MQKYQIINENTVLRTDTNSFVPMDEGNADYHDFLLWVKQGNTPDPIPGKTPEQKNNEILWEISTLESKQGRSLRQCALGKGDVEYTLKNGSTSTPAKDLAEIEAQIAALRAQLA